MQLNNCDSVVFSAIKKDKREQFMSTAAIHNESTVMPICTLSNRSYKKKQIEMN